MLFLPTRIVIKALVDLLLIEEIKVSVWLIIVNLVDIVSIEVELIDSVLLFLELLPPHRLLEAILNGLLAPCLILVLLLQISSHLVLDSLHLFLSQGKI